MSWLERHITLHGNDTPREEIANWLTHLVGVVLAIAGTVALLLRSGPAPLVDGIPAVGVDGSPSGAASPFALAVFGVSMILLFGASTAYHLSPPDSRAKRLFRLADHLSIYLLIAGTYTPVMTAIGTTWATWTLVAVWALAAVGIVLKTILWDRFRVTQVFFFLAMGWLAVIRIDEVIRLLPTPFFRLLLAGGLSYTLGTVVYALKRVPYYHAAWHVFVLAGAGSFFAGVYGYL